MTQPLSTRPLHLISSVAQSGGGAAHSPCSNCRLPSMIMAPIIRRRSSTRGRPAARTQPEWAVRTQTKRHQPITNLSPATTATHHPPQPPRLPTHSQHQHQHQRLTTTPGVPFSAPKSVPLVGPVARFKFRIPPARPFLGRFSAVSGRVQPGSREAWAAAGAAVRRSQLRVLVSKITAVLP